MEAKKFLVNGRMLEEYQLSDKQIVDLVELDENLSEDDEKYLMYKILYRFKYQCCPKSGETNDDVFARQFSDFVNGRCWDKKKVAQIMAHDHRYLQNEMFHICMEYIKILAENADNGIYDGRNEYACNTSKKMIDALKKEDWPY